MRPYAAPLRAGGAAARSFPETRTVLENGVGEIDPDKMRAVQIHVLEGGVFHVRTAEEGALERHSAVRPILHGMMQQYGICRFLKDRQAFQNTACNLFRPVV